MVNENKQMVNSQDSTQAIEDNRSEAKTRTNIMWREEIICNGTKKKRILQTGFISQRLNAKRKLVPESHMRGLNTKKRKFKIELFIRNLRAL